MNDLPPLNRLYRAYERYEQDINTPGARHNLPIGFVVRVSEELSEQATLIAHWRGRYEEARKALDTVEAELYDFRVELEEKFNPPAPL